MKVAIVGAGIVGVAAAHALLDQGHAVTLLDPRGVAGGASRGNAGWIAHVDLMPLASGKLWRQLPGWLADPLGPFTIRPAYLPRLLPWLARFVLAGRPGRVRANLEAIAALNGRALAAWEARLDTLGLSGHLRRAGILSAWSDESGFRLADGLLREQERRGIPLERLDAAGLRRLEPALGPTLTRGVLYETGCHVDDPARLTLALADAAVARGARLVAAEVAGLEPGENGIALRLGDGSRQDAERVIVAAGAWSMPLASALGDPVPLDTERGYNVTLPRGRLGLSRPVAFEGRGFVATPLDTGDRIGGAVEFGGLAAAPNFARVDAMLAKLRPLLPGTDLTGGERWMGFRPSLPDSLPVIGRSARDRRVLYAFGHGHHGLTQAAATAELVAALLAGAVPAIDPSPYRPARFRFRRGPPGSEAAATGQPVRPRVTRAAGTRRVLAVIGVAAVAYALLSAAWNGEVGIAAAIATALLAWASGRRPRREQRLVATAAGAAETRSRYSLLDAVPGPVVVVDRRVVVVAANPPARLAAPGLREGEPLSIGLRAPEVLNAVGNALAGRREAAAEWGGRLPGDTVYAVTVRPLGEADGPGAAALFFRDLTVDRLTERMRVDFVANVSHELRTPLASLAGFIDTLQGPARHDPAARDRFLEIMREQASRMTRLIDDLLQLSRVEMRAHSPPSARVEFAQAVGHIIEVTTPLARNAGVAIASEIAPDTVVIGDRDEILRLVENLLANAIKYGGSGGRIEVVVRPAADPAFVELLVRDHGPGIAPEHLPRLTERFYRVDAASGRMRGGTGLGLAIVKHIVARHRGRLAIESELGQGATVTVALPSASPADPRPGGA